LPFGLRCRKFYSRTITPADLTAKDHALAGAQDRARIVFDCRTANDPATINKESTNENNADVDRWVDARRLRINGKPCS
jgi:hypothetical protein